MIREKHITQEDFATLLTWLDPDPDKAAIRHENIRSKLIRVLAGRGCYEAEDLADETIDRVILRISRIRDTYVGEPALYFYGVANKVHLEWLRKQKKRVCVEFNETYISFENKNSDEEYERLERCLRQLPNDLHELIVEYYQKEKRAKIEHRRRLAAKWGLSLGALKTKTSRIRAKLRIAMGDLG